MATTVPLPPLPESERQRIPPPTDPDGKHDYLYGYVLHSAASHLDEDELVQLCWRMRTAPSLRRYFAMCAMESSTLALYFAVYSKRDKIVVGIESGKDTIPYAPHLDKLKEEMGVAPVGEPQWMPVLDDTFFTRKGLIDVLISIIKKRT